MSGISRIYEITVKIEEIIINLLKVATYVYQYYDCSMRHGFYVVMPTTATVVHSLM